MIRGAICGFGAAFWMVFGAMLGNFGWIFGRFLCRIFEVLGTEICEFASLRIREFEMARVRVFESLTG